MSDKKKERKRKPTGPERRGTKGPLEATAGDPRRSAAPPPLGEGAAATATGRHAGDGPQEAAGKPAQEDLAFTPAVLDRTVIAIPLLKSLKAEGAEDAPYEVVIDLNLEYPGERDGARNRVRELIGSLIGAPAAGDGKEGIHESKTELSGQYIFATLKGRTIKALVRIDRETAEAAAAGGQAKRLNAVYRIWPDFPIGRLTVKSVSTVKADAAHNAFAAIGKDIVWAVMDSGIDGGHPHFDLHRNVQLDPSLLHCDFTALGKVSPEVSSARALTDEHGHGTHVAGIIAGAVRDGASYRLVGRANERDENGDVKLVEEVYAAMSGMAPQCKLLSLKVLDKNAKGSASNMIAALEYIQRINGNGRRLRVHGVNMSVGYDFEPEWFACGQSPLCVEVDRLVRSGVVVVVAAGNTGYGWNQSAFRGAVAAGMDLTVNDPGNAELAITVGSTHRDMPHVYGVSYFSSKGPTGDGRMKPDLVAPGERIRAPVPGGHWGDLDGTSMAAPHVSGAAAMLMARHTELVGQPRRIKRILCESATDLGRERSFQGHGMLDALRALQSV